MILKICKFLLPFLSPLGDLSCQLMGRVSQLSAFSPALLGDQPRHSSLKLFLC